MKTIAYYQGTVGYPVKLMFFFNPSDILTDQENQGKDFKCQRINGKQYR
jgi:hypothetical protein